ncbi:natriuretic peptides A-like [Vidua chalybeata]|uniref:natriuretic peptides A-like n=1 Tax=Vidua chalybeata TaxID=81927 RepID=UPI0023A91078|nr:natriuretic peptides A-like [Vidua chalybeata]
MQFPALCCGAALLLLVMPWAEAQAAGEERGAELRSPQDLLQSLRQLREEEGEPSLETSRWPGLRAAAPSGSSPGAESGRAGAPVLAPDLPSQRRDRASEGASSLRQRHCSCCFGTRMERSGAQTGLGCDRHRARGCRAEQGRPGQPPGAAAVAG